MWGVFWRNPKSWWKTNHAVIGFHPDWKLKLSQTQPSLPKPAEIRRGQLIPSRLQTRTMDRGYCSRFIVRFGYMSGGWGRIQGAGSSAFDLSSGTGGGGGSWLCVSDLFVCQHNCRVIATLKLQFAVTSRDSVRQYDWYTILFLYNNILLLTLHETW